MPRSLRRALLVLLAAPLAVFVYVSVALFILHRVRGIEFSYEHAGTDLTFASSDGGWRGEEDMMRGRQFEDVLLDFELYRIHTNQPEVRLLRTKPWKQPYKWAWWYDRRSAVKWRVPYVRPEEVPAARSRRFSAKDATSVEQTRARQAMEMDLERLRSSDFPPSGR